MAGYSVHEMEVGIRMSTPTYRFGRLMMSVKKIIPYLAIGFLVASGILQINRSQTSDALKRHHRDIAIQISEFPYQVGGWVGQDVVIPTSAQEILKPNGLVSRRFSRYGGDGNLTFALIHCIDLRDMHGHHPPRCYPASGWSIRKTDVTEEETVDVIIGDVPDEMRVYRFIQGGPMEPGSELTVVSVFLTPVMGVVKDMAILQEIGSMGRGASGLGVGQIQLVFSGNRSNDELEVQVNDFISKMPRELLSDMMTIPEEEDEDHRKYTFDEGGRS